MCSYMDYYYRLAIRIWTTVSYRLDKKFKNSHKFARCGQQSQLDKLGMGNGCKLSWYGQQSEIM